MSRRQPQASGGLGTLQQLGVSLDPLQQLSGLVNLINQTQAPMIQQDQFGREMDFRALQGDRQWQHENDQLGLQQSHYDQQQMNADRGFGLQEQQLGQTQDYQNAMIGNRQAGLAMASRDRQMGNQYDMLRLILSSLADPNGPGMIDPNIGSQMLNQAGFAGLINPQEAAPQSPYDSSNINKDLPDAAFRQAYQKHTVR